MANLCIVCGQERIVIDTQKEYLNGSLLITTIASCPDPECQKRLDSKLEGERVEREKLRSKPVTTPANKAKKKTDDDDDDD